jgi:hypothetical protein
MPTIDELPSATGTGPQDLLPIDQSGVTRSVSVAEVLASTQPLIEVPSPSVLGRSSLGPGGPESLAIGVGLVVQNASIAANGGDHAFFIQESSFVSTDEVIINSSGTPKQLPIPALRALFSAGNNVTISSTGQIGATTDPSVTIGLQTLAQSLSSATSAIATINAEIPAGGIAGLNSNGQVTAPVAGDASVATVKAGGVGVARLLEAREVDTINIVDFGAVTGGADCTAAFNAAFAQLPGGGGEIFIPGGDYWFSSSLVLSGKPVIIRGVGKGQTKLHIQHTGVALDFTPGTPFNKVLVTNLSLYAESAAGQCAAGIRVTYPAVAGFGYVTTVINEVELFGYPNQSNGAAPFPQSFLRGIVLVNTWSTQVRNCSWFGPPSAAGASTSAVIEVNNAIDTRIQSLQAYYGNVVVLQTGYCEGIYLNAPAVIGVDYLVSHSDETQWAGYSRSRPMLLGLWVSDGEVNTNLGTVVLQQVTDGFFVGLDIARDQGPNSSQTFFDLTDVSNFIVSDCNFVGGPSGGSNLDVAFNFKSVVNSSSNIITNCVFANMTTVIKINGGNGTVGLITHGLQIGNVPLATAIIDQSIVSSGNYLSFIGPPQGSRAAGIGNSKDHVWNGTTGNVLFQVNNVTSAANFLRHQPAVTANAPALCFDGSDSVVNGVIQTKGGNLYLNAAGGTGGSGNMLSLLNTFGATNWPVLVNATSGNPCVMTTNAGGLTISPVGALRLAPSAGVFMSGLPTAKPTAGSGQVWNNNGVLSIA